MLPLYHMARWPYPRGFTSSREATPRFDPVHWERQQSPLVVPDTWCLKEEEEEADLWECAVLESAVAAAAAAEMQSFEQEMEDDQPLDLSMKPRGLDSPLTLRPARPEGKARGQDSPLCLIKDCGCNNHGPKSRASGGASIYDCGKYGPPAGDLASDGPPIRFSGADSLESRSVGRDSFETQRSCYSNSDVPRMDMCRSTGVDRTWESRRLPSEEEIMDTNLEHARFDEHNSTAQSRYKLAFRTCVSTEREQPSANYKPPLKFYDSCDQNPQSFVDLNNSGSNRDSIWRPPANNEESFRPVNRPWGEDSASQWGWSGRVWNRSDSYPSQSHWRPFTDNTGPNLCAGRGHHQSQETLKSRAEFAAKQSKSVLSGAVNTTPQNLGNKAQSSGGSSSMPPTRSICHTFASTVPLITNSSSVPGKRETQSLPSTPRNSGSPMVVPRAPYTTIRVTRSPKTFHNETVRAALDADTRGCPFKRPQDCGRRFMPGKMGSQGKENIDLTDSGQPGSDVPSEGVKMPALDYLISKVLVERIDIPFKPCNTEIKKIYNGESKGRLRLADLIELQVEESLKA